VRFTDGSTLKLLLMDPKIDVTTPYGKLSVPVADVHTLEFATRTAEDDTKTIEKAISDLGGAEFKTRESATATLVRLGARAYPALLEAAKSKDAEVKRRAEAILEKIRQDVPADSLKVRKLDTITGEGFKLTGRIDVSTLRVDTTQFGELKVRLADVRSLRSLAVKAAPAAAMNVQPDPGSPGALANQIGKAFYFQVTGVAQGALWGTDVYTSDSTIAMAAVHAGVVKVGETGIVKVTMVVPPPNYQGSTRNGVTSSEYGQWDGAYMVEKAEPEE